MKIFIILLLAFSIFLAPTISVAQAADPPSLNANQPLKKEGKPTQSKKGPELWIECGGGQNGTFLAGCDAGGTRFTDYLSTYLLPLLFEKLITYISAFGYLFIMIGGVYILTSAGSEDRVEKGKKTITWAVIGIFIARFAYNVVGFVRDEASSVAITGDIVTNVITTLTGSIFTLMNTALVMVALYSGMRMVLSLGKEDEFKKGQEGLFYAALGAIIVNISSLIFQAFANL